MNLHFIKTQFTICILIVLKCNAQTSDITLINKNHSWDNIYFSICNSSSNMPITSRQMFGWNKFDIGKYINKVSTDEPLQFNFSWDWKSQSVYLFPGDTLEFALTDNKTLPYKFTGSRPSKELMFFSQLEATESGYMSQGNFGIAITKKLNFQYIADETFKRYSNRLNFLTDVSDSSKFSDKGRKTFEQALRYKYISELFFPYGNLSDSSLHFDHTIIPDFYKEKLRDFGKELNNNSLMYLVEYRVCIYLYARFKMIESGENNLSLVSLLRFYKENFTGQTRDFLSYNEIMLNYRMSGALAKKDQWNNTFQNTALRDTLISIQDKLDNRLSDRSLQTELESATGEKISLGELLMNYPQNLIYLDFWATWCGPCLLEMPASEKLQQEFNNGSIEFVYLSIDSDKQRWLKKTATLPQGKNAHHYRVKDGLRFMNEMGGSSVPRYMLIGKNGGMINFNAPRPRSLELRRLINENIGR